MRNLKIVLWIFIIFLLQTVVLTRVHVYGAVPSVVLPFLVCAAIVETDFRLFAVITVISSVAAGALGGRDFTIVTLYLFYSSLIVAALRRKPVHIAQAAKALLWTFILSGIAEMMFLFISTKTISVNMLLYAALPTALMNTVFAAVIYPLLKRTMYKEEKKKLLIGDLV